MKRSISLVLFLILPWLVFGCGRGKETAAHKGHEPETKQDSSKAEDLEMKGLTMESIEKEGKMQEVAAGTIQITPERQQLIGVKIGTVETRPLEKVIRAVGTIDYEEKGIATVSVKVGGGIEDLYVDFTGRYVRKGEPLPTISSPELVSTQEEYLTALEAKKSLSKSSIPEGASSGDTLVDSARRRTK